LPPKRGTYCISVLPPLRRPSSEPGYGRSPSHAPRNLGTLAGDSSLSQPKGMRGRAIEFGAFHLQYD
jgi:hypothetical protein